MIEFNEREWKLIDRAVNFLLHQLLMRDPKNKNLDEYRKLCYKVFEKLCESEGKEGKWKD